MRSFFRKPEKIELVLLALLTYVWSFGMFMFKAIPNKIEPLIIILVVWATCSFLQKDIYFNIWLLLITILTAYPVFLIFYLK